MMENPSLHKTSSVEENKLRWQLRILRTKEKSPILFSNIVSLILRVAYVCMLYMYVYAYNPAVLAAVHCA